MKKLYFNGDIVTMKNENDIVTAVITENDKIVSVGNYEDLKNEKVDETYDLKGQTMLPAFIDPHSHFSFVVSGQNQVDLNDTKDFEDIRKRFRDFISKNNIKEGTFINSMGYDQNFLKEGKHPTKWDIDCDEVLAKYPIMLTHVSSHMGVLNQKALDFYGVTKENCDEHGEVDKKDGEPTGLMIEAPFMDKMLKAPKPSTEQCLNMLEEGAKIYLKNGITTAQEGLAPDTVLDFYKGVEERKLADKIGMEFQLYPSVDAIDLYKANFDSEKYKDGIKVGGSKIISDGSPQGRSAWMRKPYVQIDATDDPNYAGFPAFSDDVMYEMLSKIYDAKLQPIVHVNGDRACQQYIDVMQRLKDEGKDFKELRPVMIHAQFLGLDQMKQVKELGLITSFFVGHVYYWGDVHVKNNGFEKASHISPAGSAIKNDIMYTFHQDTPVIKPNMIETLWCATNRITKNGVVLGEDEKISIYDALKGITINAAYQYFEEDIKGTIEVEKQADFVILNKNPLKIKVEDVNKLQVMATIKKSKVVYKK